MRYLLLTSSMLLAIIGQFFLKRGVLLSNLTPNVQSIVQTIISPFVLIGFLAYGTSSIIWLFVVQKFPLSVAYPALSLTYIAIVIVSIYVLKEPFTQTKVFGIFLIIMGVYFLFK